jgi:1,4-dihydroxy-2-naphthoyl-CoA hydrolase
MRYFPESVNLDKLNQSFDNSMLSYLEMKVTEIKPDYLKATMPVNEKTKQTLGMLNGGATTALAESMGSQASVLMVNDTAKKVIGIEINANHIGTCTDGMVEAIVKPLHIGRKTHVWDIKIYDDEQKLLSVCRLTTLIVAS